MPPPFRFQPRVVELGGAAAELPAAELAQRLAARDPRRALVLLDGWPRGASLVAFDPLPARAPRSLRGLRGLVARLAPCDGDAVPGGFHGGFLGALAYDLGAAAERGLVLPPDPWRLAPVLGRLFVDFLVRVPGRGTFLVLGEEPGDGRASVSARAREIETCLARAHALEPCVPRGPLRRLVPPAEHARRVRRVRELIAEGEIYQANLSWRAERDVAGDPLDLWRRLATLHPAPYLAYVRERGVALLSASPELLLELEPRCDDGRLARTRPIKGTAARAAEPAEDRARAAALLASEKDLSELAMIVDLERNDLGRIAVPGSVAVAGFPTLESYATVHHLVADVSARVRSDVDALACLASLFPGGSVTGAPKLRSMEVIAELEGEGRGFAYGALVALDTRGALTASLLIRTLIWRARGRAAGEVCFRVGGGITWGSDPAAEEAEAAAKGARLAQALDGPEDAAELARADRLAVSARAAR